MEKDQQGHSVFVRHTLKTCYVLHESLNKIEMFADAEFHRNLGRELDADSIRLTNINFGFGVGEEAKKAKEAFLNFLGQFDKKNKRRDSKSNNSSRVGP